MTLQLRLAVTAQLSMSPRHQVATAQSHMVQPAVTQAHQQVMLTSLKALRLMRWGSDKAQMAQLRVHRCMRTVRAAVALLMEHLQQRTPAQLHSYPWMQGLLDLSFTAATRSHCNATLPLCTQLRDQVPMAPAQR